MTRTSCLTCCPSVRTRAQITRTQVSDFRVSSAEASSSGGGEHAVDSADGVDERTGLKVATEAGRIDAVVKRVQPGELRQLFISNLRRCMVGTMEGLSSSVRKAQFALGGPRETGVLEEEAGVLGEGGFGVVKGARHSVFPGKFALKRIDKVRVLQSAL